MKPKMLIVSIENDIHALAVVNELKNTNTAYPYLLEVDRLSTRSIISWSLDSQGIPSVVLNCQNEEISLDNIDLI